MCCAQLAGNAGLKKSPKFAIWAPSHNFVGLYVTGSEKTRLKSEVLVVGKKRNSVQRSQNVKICFFNIFY